jgi:hypothetical protein
MRLDYKPVFDTRAVKQSNKLMQLIPELLKYITKESNFVTSREWLLECTRQLHKMRMIATDGVLKQYLKELEQDPEDLIGQECEESEDVTVLYLNWRRQEKRHRMIDN